MYITEVFHEIRNFFYIRKVVKEAILTKPWQEFNLRFDWMSGKIYTVINLPENFPNLPDLTREAFVTEELKGINRYLASLNLHEVITLETPKKIDNLNYLVVYSPVLNYFTKDWVISKSFKYGLGLTISLYLHFKWDLFNKAFHLIKTFFDFLF